MTEQEILDRKWLAIGDRHRLTEADAVASLLPEVQLSQAERERVSSRAMSLVQGCRDRFRERTIVDKFLSEYGLSSEEGVVLLCLVEALLRIPDERTAEELISEKVRDGDWETHVGHSASVLVNASTWALILTGNVFKLSEGLSSDVTGWLRRFTSRVGEGMSRRAMIAAINILSQSFVAGQTIEEAVKGAKGPTSFDMLGEGARTWVGADRYLDSYTHALEHIKEGFDSAPYEHTLSIKLTALHPRIEPLNEDSVMEELTPRLQSLVDIAAPDGIGITIDAEETFRYETLLKLVAALVRANPDYQGLGLAVQAYTKRSFAVIDWLRELAKQASSSLTVRLVKGAYWDTEVKLAQVNGHANYPVYTRKSNTDLSYLACAGKLLKSTPWIKPAFATHNAHTLAAVRVMAKDTPFEYQRIFGMGELLYSEAANQLGSIPDCRVYAPVGLNHDLMPYLMRRLLENGANSSFVNRLLEMETPLDEVVSDPLDVVPNFSTHAHPEIPLPIDLYGDERSNSLGLDLGDTHDRSVFKEEVESWRDHQWTFTDEGEEVRNPADPSDVVGVAPNFSVNDLNTVVANAKEAQRDWDRVPVHERSTRIEKFADAIRDNRCELTALLQREAGKTVQDAVDELREAEDFCRYYARQARELFRVQELPSPTGETNHLRLCGRGVFACIAPWNFPASIFVGPPAAALVAGNTVVAKPAPQTRLIAQRLEQLAADVGLGSPIFNVAPGGDDIGQNLVAHADIDGVAFTGSVAAAKSIARALADRPGPLVPLIAETGGVNAMVVDSSALLEHVVDDIVHSAFFSAGQRCSALRLLCVQEEISDLLIEMVIGAMDTLKVGNPSDWSVDVGPVIDVSSKELLKQAITDKRILHTVGSSVAEPSNHVLPTLVDVPSVPDYDNEFFGPIVGVHRFKAQDMEAMVRDLNGLGYGLTFGIHSRVEERVSMLSESMRAGNTYVNRSMTGAVVGTQPFGGEGLSGTGPKAGGPHYVRSFSVERVVTRNETATGGNVELMRLSQ